METQEAAGPTGSTLDNVLSQQYRVYEQQQQNCGFGICTDANLLDLLNSRGGNINDRSLSPVGGTPTNTECFLNLDQGLEALHSPRLPNSSSCFQPGSSSISAWVREGDKPQKNNETRECTPCASHEGIQGLFHNAVERENQFDFGAECSYDSWKTSINNKKKTCGPRCVKCLALKHVSSRSSHVSVVVHDLPLPQYRVRGQLSASHFMEIPSKISPTSPLRFPIKVGSFYLEAPENSTSSFNIPSAAQCCLRWECLDAILIFFAVSTNSKENCATEESQFCIPSEQLRLQGFSKEFVYSLWQLYQKNLLHFSPEPLWLNKPSNSDKKCKRNAAYGILAGINIGVEILQGFELHDEEDGEINSKRSKHASLGAIFKGLLESGHGLVYGPDSDRLLNWLKYEDEGQLYGRKWVWKTLPCLKETSKRKPNKRRGALKAKTLLRKKTEHKKELPFRARTKCKEKSNAKAPALVEVLTMQTNAIHASFDDDSFADQEYFDVFKVFEEISNYDIPLATLPDGITCKAKKYQLQALAWMKQRENATLESSSSARRPIYLHPCWIQVITEDGQMLYINRVNESISVNFYPAPSSSTCGGLLCDEMGLGKTLEILMLILAHPPPTGWAVRHEPPKKKAKKSEAKCDLLHEKPKRGIVSNQKNKIEGDDSNVFPIKATLIIVPATLLNQWQQEILVHIKPGRLVWTIYNGYEDVQWDKLDIVFTSYEVLRKVIATVESPLLKYGFWRIVLDEAQLVAKSNSVAALTASKIFRRHAWVVTGTPVTARLEELQGLLDFLAVEPFGEPSVWHAMFQGPFVRHEEIGLRRLRLLLRRILLRRTKQQVHKEITIPPCVKEDIYITLSATEGSNYDYCYKEFLQAAEALKRKRARRGAVESYDLHNVSSKVTGRMLAALTRLRQSCCHPQIIKRESGFLGNLRLTMEEIMQKLVLKAKVEYDGATKDWIQSRISLATAQRSTNDLKLLLNEIQEHKSASKARYNAIIGTDTTHCAERKNVSEYKGILDTMQLQPCKAQGQKTEDAIGSCMKKQSQGISDGPAMNAIECKQYRVWCRLELSAWLAYAKLIESEEGNTSSAVIDTASALNAIDSLKELLGISQLKLTAPVSHVNTRGAKRRQMESLSGKPAPELSQSYNKKALSQDAIVREIERTRCSMQRLMHNEKHLEEKWAQMSRGRDKQQTNLPSYLPFPSNIIEDEDSNSLIETGNKDVLYENATTCPVCFESFVDNSSVTVCGHYFCSHCIQEVVSMRDKSSRCPICRTPLQPSDIFSVCLQAEESPPDLNGEYGAKISALLSELILLSEKDPGAKSVVFSSWSRLLNIISAALDDNNMAHTYLTGTEQNRQEAIRRFNTDPDIRCILVIMANAGGASGLSLTAASNVFILEPSLNPGLEAQAAGRVHRLTQVKPTRIVRFIAEGTIEEKILNLQKKKMTTGTDGLVMEELHGNDLLELVGG